jgi:class 3 adenylate cyclase/tetratricopeptide (TPR) repeat protein
MTERLRPYVPSLVIDWLRNEPDLAHRRVEGSFVFADISGFTQLTERLAKLGKLGVEEMGDLLNDRFESLLIPAYEYGGALVKWGGDAVLLLFQGEEHAPRAVRAAYEMQKVIARVGRLATSAGSVRLKMSVGVHSGELDFFLVGDQHRELIAAGPAVSAVTGLEKLAEAGEILVSSSTAGALDPECFGLAKGTGVLVASAPPAPLMPRTSPDPLPLPDVSACIPPELHSYLSSDHVENEHRHVVAGFISFTGLDLMLDKQGPAAVADNLAALVDTATSEAARYGVTFLGSDVALDGGKLIFAAGAPYSHGELEDRLLATLLAVLNSPTALSLRAGANAGRVFAGDYGPPYRRTYSVVGDSVNLAARLMDRAQPGELVATRSTAHGCRTVFTCTEMTAFHVKGKSDPIEAVIVGPPSAAASMTPSADNFPFLGRDNEIVAILGALDAARAGTGRLVEIIAEAGLGKSRLIEEAFDRAHVGRIQVACDVYEVSSPYAPAQRLLRGLLDVAADSDTPHVGRLLTEIVTRRCPHLLPWLPLIATVVGATVPSTPQVDALAERFRRDRLNQAVVELVSAIATEPTVFVVEDAHHMDDASADLLQHLADILPMRPWLLVVTRRPTATGLVAKDGEHVESMWLTPLSEDTCEALLEAVTSDAGIANHEIDRIRENSGGNPLFMRELLAARDQLGDIETLPHSLEGVISAQIDALPLASRQLLRAASVLGMTVSKAALQSLLSVDGVTVAAEGWSVLETFLEPEGGDLVRFRHALVHKAAYESLPYRRRRDLHGRAGEALVATATGPLDQLLPALSFHFHNAQRHAESLLYSRQAGDQARARYAGVEAAQFYERALDAAQRVRALTDQAGVAEALGETWFNLGELTKADAAYRIAFRHLRNDPIDSARIRLLMVRVSVRAGRYIEALSSLSRGRRQLEIIDSAESKAWRARLAAQYAYIRRMQGRERDALDWAHRALVDAKAAQARDAMAQGYQLVDEAHLALGRVDDGTTALEALHIWEELGDRGGQAIVLNHLGTRAYFLGEWVAALDYYERSRQVCEDMGDQWRAAVCAWNIAEIYVDQGRLDDADAMTRKALRTFRAIGSPNAIAGSDALLGRIAAREGRFDEGRQLLDAARDIYRAEGDLLDAVDTEARLAECLLLEGRADEALALAEQTLTEVPESDGLAAAVPLLHRVRGLAYAQRGELIEARAALEASLLAARLRRAGHDVALTIEAMHTVARIDRTSVHPTLIAERDELFARLGIAATAPVPLPATAGMLPQPRGYPSPTGDIRI